MRYNRLIRSLLLFSVIASLSQVAFAQKYEAYAYGGGFWPGKIDEFKIQNQAIWGGRFGAFLSDRLQVEGNLGYLNHFLFDDSDIDDTVFVNNITVITVLPEGGFTVTELDANNVAIIEPSAKQRGYLWEGNLSYHFFGAPTGKFAPYLTAGIGGLTMTRSEVTSGDIIINQPGLTPEELDALNEIIRDRVDDARSQLTPPINDGSYFAFNYGAGLKGYRIWGPVGLRMDVLGHTLPNFSGRSLTAFQLSGGITFAWGER